MPPHTSTWRGAPSTLGGLVAKGLFLGALSIGFGMLYGAIAAALFSRGADAPIGAVFGFVLGALSCLYTIPFLIWTRIEFGIPLVFGGGLVAAIAGSMLNPFAAILAVVAAQVCLGAQCRFSSQPPITPGVCATCGYDLSGLPGPVCPECGTTTLTDANAAP